MTYSDGHNTPGPPSPDRSRLTLLTGLLALLTSLLALVMMAEIQRYPYRPPFHDSIESPVLAVELARNKEDLTKIFGTEHPGEAANAAMDEGGGRQDGRPSAFERFMIWEAVSSLKANTVEDLAFIPLYALFVMCLASVMTSSADRTGVVLTQVVGTLIFLAAVLDYVEDRGIFRSLVAKQLTDELAQYTRWHSLGKWSLIALSLLLLAAILFRSSSLVYKRGIRLSLAGLCAASGLLMLIALPYPRLMLLANSLFATFVLANAGGLLFELVSQKSTANSSAGE